SFGAHHLAERWAMAGGPENYDACTKLLALAPRPEDRAVVVEGLAAAFESGKVPELPPALSTALNDYLAKQLDGDPELVVKTGSAEAEKKALAVIKDEKAPLLKRAALVQAFAEAQNKAVIPAILQIFNRAGSAAGTLRQAILPYAARFDDP